MSECVIGVSCERHRGQIHGREAEELRAGIERVLRESGDSSMMLRDGLMRLLDIVDALDSLAYCERRGARPAQCHGCGATDESSCTCWQQDGRP